MNKKGKFIVVEGIGASGKDTQVELLEKYLKNEGIDVLVTREHTRDTPPGILIEKIIKKKEKQIDPLALQLLYTCDRRNHCVKVVEPELAKGKLVIGNRFYPTGVAYCRDEWNRKTILRINKMIATKPDLVLIIDTAPEIAIERMNKRGDPDIFDKLDSMKKNSEGYKWYLKNSGDRCVVVNGNGTVEEVHQRVIKAINKSELIRRPKPRNSRS